MFLVLAFALATRVVADDFRPVYHFGPQENWMNEPNGKYLGKSELGPRNHENGVEAFTGTSYYDVDNTSGLGSSTSPPYLAYYTGYFPSNGTQDLRLAFSVDDGVTWTKYQGNPIISAAQESPHDETGGLEARDPKVFFHLASGQWVMVLAHGGQDKLTFWTSSEAS
ncbi:hypothetical protein PENFLA_c035G07169 [Penicillium flavigenum]|uniref:Glycosyl hydrolase family 32 N-terminal domain-containing protein n=1 Tax=Penicillium flavigenum TaxID=254877 RepID=A0A1V6SMD4_9EURO|nr:hypothetical protein PENFLA_c035G07169 [Penicillium flavigenum]